MARARRLVVGAVSSLLLAASPAKPGTIHVPGDYPQIQQAIEAAVDGDEVVVAPGLYLERIDFKGKAVHLRSTAGPDLTVIDGGFSGPTVMFQSNESAGAILDGFTVTHGSSGIRCVSYAAPTIVNNTITENDLNGIRCDGYAVISDNLVTNNGNYDWGGGISTWSALVERNTITSNRARDGGGVLTHDGLVRDNVITGNRADTGGGIIVNGYATIVGNHVADNFAYRGGAIALAGAIDGPIAVSVTNNVIIANRASVDGGGGISCENLLAATISSNLIAWNFTDGAGGGIWVNSGNNITLTNNTLFGNTSLTDAGGVSNLSSLVAVFNMIVWGNTGRNGAQLGGSVSVSFSDIQGAWPGQDNLDTDPLFVDVSVGDLHLLSTSPCVNAGSNVAPGLTLLDIDGSPRIMGGMVDIGADEVSDLRRILHLRKP